MKSRKSTLFAYTFMLLGSFKIFKVCLDAKGRVVCGKQRETTALIQSLVKLPPWFLSLKWKVNALAMNDLPMGRTSDDIL